MATKKTVRQKTKTHVHCVVQFSAMLEGFETRITKDGQQSGSNRSGNDESSQPSQLCDVEHCTQFCPTRGCDHELLDPNHIGKNAQRDGERESRSQELRR